MTGSDDRGGKAQRPPKGEPWIWITREVLRSRSWRGLGINARRVVDFLLLEHMGHGGRHNGRLKAPRRQLVRSGISAGLVSAAIAEVEAAGLVIVHRGGMRVASTYTLAWLPLHDGDPPYPAWRKQESGPASGARAGTACGARRRKSGTTCGARNGRTAGTGSGAPLKKSNQARSSRLGRSNGDEAAATDEPLGSDAGDT